MINIEANVSLSDKNTLAVPSTASFYAQLRDIADIPDLFTFAVSQNLSVRVLGGGSNLVLKSHINALVIHVQTTGRDVMTESAQKATVKVQAGENWHEFVLWSIENGLSGLENLALIPGSVGAAPVQNIGAYGVEVGELITEVEAFDSQLMRTVLFSNEQCKFGYRDSIFKQSENRYLITSVTFSLNKSLQANLNYGPLRDLAKKDDLVARDIFDAVCQIRLSKLPDPEKVPNAGSFFKNPIVSKQKAAELKESFEHLVCFPYDSGCKLAAGWLIEYAGFKGRESEDGVGCFKDQALVVINPKRRSAESVLAWAAQIQAAIQTTFGVSLEVEPRAWE